MSALEKARRVRAKRADLYRRMQSHDVTLADVLRRTPACIRNASIYDVVRHAHRMGDAGALNVLRRAKVGPLTKVKMLDQDQRDAVLKHLPPRAR